MTQGPSQAVEAPHLSDRIDDLIVRMARFVSQAVAGASLLGFVGLLVANILARTVRGAAIVGAVEASGLLVAIFAGFAAVEAEARRAHIAMTVGVDQMPPAVRRWSLTIAHLVAPVVTAILAYSLYTGAMSSRGRGEIRSVTLTWQVWPYRLAFAGALALFVLILLRTLWRHVLRKEPSDAPQEAARRRGS